MTRTYAHTLLASFTLMMYGGAIANTGATEPVLSSAQMATGGVSFTWTSGATNNSFAVQSVDRLHGGTWRYSAPVDDWPVVATNWTGPTSAAARFFRVRAYERGQVSDVTAIRDFSLSELTAGLTPYGITPTYAVSTRKVSYRTFDPRDVGEVASGALLIPEGAGSVPLACYQHGTVTRDADAPSNGSTLEFLLGLALASGGYAVVLPDYLGLGDVSPGLHPYVHARSEAVVAVDLLRAARALLETEPGLNWNGQLFLGGYSQGGHAVLALQRELESHHTNEFAVTASAPMAGPYDLSGVMFNIMVGSTSYTSPSYLPYMLLAYDEIYGLFDGLDEVFLTPYDTNLPNLFDGTLTTTEIDGQLPAIPRQMFEPSFVASVTNNPEHPLRLALRANDLYDWTPRATTRLYHCSGDVTVPIENTYVAFSNFVANGATGVAVIDPSPGADHGDCVLPSVLAAKAWFDTLKE